MRPAARFRRAAAGASTPAPRRARPEPGSRGSERRNARNGRPARPAPPWRPQTIRDRSSPHCQEAAEIVPLEEDLRPMKTDRAQQGAIFLQSIRDEDVFECLALLSDLDFRVTVAPLEIVIVLDEQ